MGQRVRDVRQSFSLVTLILVFSPFTVESTFDLCVFHTLVAASCSAMGPLGTRIPLESTSLCEEAWRRPETAARRRRERTLKLSSSINYWEKNGRLTVARDPWRAEGSRKRGHQFSSRVALAEMEKLPQNHRLCRLTPPNFEREGSDSRQGNEKEQSAQRRASR